MRINSPRATSNADLFMSESTRPPELADHPLILTWPVQWGDQDAFGHVNNVVYFRWMESARIEYFRRSGLGTIDNSGVGPILASIKCDFRRQLKFPDTLLISGSILSIGRTSMKMAHRVYSQTQQAIAAEGDSVLVFFDYRSQKPVVVPDQIRAMIDAFEGRKTSGA
jgi:acyl-CoA thioester hydrolase